MCWLALEFLPWPRGRQMLLLDPPCDSVQFSGTWNVFAISRLLQRFLSSCVALWYTLVDREQVAGLYSQVQSLEACSVLVAELQLEKSRPREAALQGSGQWW
ncbi:unnamed protein product [Prorocentrum cordatum]|uniref:Uncharacterized protein n=1 Tax=Prorocentrum cordatum TaxID=2364126 RepID=A0ABN9PZD0_9DINO|nr:unnamed protein product [Polarella glacialis]CAK0834068.1 unnamed protein product [Polarella glacialis]